MGFQNATSSTHIKFLTLATLLVCIWFLYTIPESAHHPHGPGWHRGGRKDSVELLPPEEAKEYCAARRWEPYPHREQRRKVYDLIIVNTELEWLEIRLGQMADQVDYFVVIESAKTFTDADKPLYVKESWDRFKKYHHKMIRHTLDMSGIEFENTWARERFSRNAVYEQVVPKLTGEQEAFKGDVILVSDVDEIPRPDAIKALRNCDFPKQVTMHTKMFYYGFQWLKREDWPHPQATFYDLDKTVLPDELRWTHDGANLYNAGWHCSYCFSTVAEMVNKIKSFSHSELDKDEFKDVDKIVARVRGGKDMFDRDSEHFDRVEDNPDIPQFLLRHPESYNYLWDRDPPNANFKDLVDYKPPPTKA